MVLSNHPMSLSIAQSEQEMKGKVNIVSLPEDLHCNTDARFSYILNIVKK